MPTYTSLTFVTKNHSHDQDREHSTILDLLTMDQENSKKNPNMNICQDRFLQVSWVFYLLIQTKLNSLINVLSSSTQFFLEILQSAEGSNTKLEFPVRVI